MSDITRKYPWAVNKQKLERAIETLEHKVEIEEIAKYTEKDVRETYESFAGAVREVE